MKLVKLIESNKVQPVLRWFNQNSEDSTRKLIGSTKHSVNSTNYLIGSTKYLIDWTKYLIGSTKNPISSEN